MGSQTDQPTAALASGTVWSRASSGGRGGGFPVHLQCPPNSHPPSLGIRTVGEGRESFQTLNRGDRAFAAKDKAQVT